MFTSLLNSKSSFALTALFVTWFAVALLLLIVGNLHVRLQRLEQSTSTPKEAMPYGRLLGIRLQDLLSESLPEPCILIFLSSNCTSCMRILSEMESLAWTVPLAIGWTDRTPAESPALPPNTIALEQGSQISKALSIRVTPFVVVISENGRIVSALPLHSVSALRDLVSNISKSLLDRSPINQVEVTS